MNIHSTEYDTEFKVVDSFLENEKFNELKNLLEDETLPYYSMFHTTTEDFSKKHDFFFKHNIYSEGPDSKLWPSFKILGDALEATDFHNMRVNLTVYREENLPFPSHTDTLGYYGNTAILYMNDSDGGTILGNGLDIKVECIANRLLVFKSGILHYNESHTHPRFRYVVNMNFYPKRNSLFDFGDY